LKGKYIKPRNWELDQSSSWANYFLGRDHSAKKCTENSSESIVRSSEKRKK
jgi:hypothetical protein